VTHQDAPQIGEDILREIRYRLPSDKSESETGIHKRFAEFGLRRVVRIEVNRVRVLRQERKPRIVCCENGAAETMFVDIAYYYFEIFVQPSFPSRSCRHFVLFEASFFARLLLPE